MVWQALLSILLKMLLMVWLPSSSLVVLFLPLLLATFLPGLWASVGGAILGLVLEAYVVGHEVCEDGEEVEEDGGGEGVGEEEAPNSSLSSGGLPLLEDVGEEPLVPGC